MRLLGTADKNVGGYFPGSVRSHISRPKPRAVHNLRWVTQWENPVPGAGGRAHVVAVVVPGLAVARLILTFLDATLSPSLSLGREKEDGERVRDGDRVAPCRRRGGGDPSVPRAYPVVPRSDKDGGAGCPGLPCGRRLGASSAPRAPFGGQLGPAHEQADAPRVPPATPGAPPTPRRHDGSPRALFLAARATRAAPPPSFPPEEEAIAPGKPSPAAHAAARGEVRAASLAHARPRDAAMASPCERVGFFTGPTLARRMGPCTDTVVSRY
ncbi:hypothetical protein HPB51_025087 [Rhipicephalus microplus]|uniref:Uncharacterized protein n=1 Tax=Rhipicephalus microplus TaxID=6941 RepID=A0A9J6DK40_RHIMP|nr:hypothetical protein HPB51_025087 [Rhipicephalus microplus]